jgi:hypothetical protein
MVNAFGTKKTAAASEALSEMLEIGFDRHAYGVKKKILALGWAALCGNITEPEACILLGRAGELKRYADKGYLQQIDLPAGLKASTHFPHQHYYHLTEKGMLFVAHHVPHLACYGNRPLAKATYLHDHIARLEAAWRVRVLRYTGYIPECRLPELSYALQKQHDGHLISARGGRVGMEIELGEQKTGEKLDKFAAQCMNSITNERVEGVLVLTPTDAIQKHYAKAFAVGKTYCTEWVKQSSNKWKPKLSSQTVITPELAKKVVVGIIRSKRQIEIELIPPEPTYPAVEKVNE